MVRRGAVDSYFVAGSRQEIIAPAAMKRQMERFKRRMGVIVCIDSPVGPGYDLAQCFANILLASLCGAS